MAPKPVILRLLLLAVILAGLLLSACSRTPDGKFAFGFPTPAPTVAPTATPTPTFYTVRQGDSLWSIARQFGVDVDTLIRVNELADPSLLQPGQTLLISTEVTISGQVLPTATPTPVPCLQGCKYPVAGCEIKAFAARLDGVKLYLLPGDEIYPRRQADLWYCREQDAHADGWRHWTPNGPAPQ